MTRAIVIVLNSTSDKTLIEYAERIADLVDDAMQAQEESHEMPAGITYEGVVVEDPDSPESSDTVQPEVIEP